MLESIQFHRVQQTDWMNSHKEQPTGFSTSTKNRGVSVL